MTRDSDVLCWGSALPNNLSSQQEYNNTLWCLLQELPSNLAFLQAGNRIRKRAQELIKLLGCHFRPVWKSLSAW